MNANEIPNYVWSTLDLEFPLTVEHHMQLLRASLTGIKHEDFVINDHADLNRSWNTNSLCMFIETAFSQYGTTNALGLWG